jgi:hypothetical protein
MINLEESTAVQYLLRQGAIRALRSILLRQGRIKFGEPDAAIEAQVEALDDLDQLRRLSVRLILVNSWQQLIDGLMPDTPLMIPARTR